MKTPNPTTSTPPTRFGPTDQFWIVIDPTTDSELCDILFATSLRNLELQFRGGLTCDRNPSLFTNREEAEAEATTRLVAAKVAKAIAASPAVGTLRDAQSVVIHDGSGRQLFRAALERIGP